MSCWFVLVWLIIAPDRLELKDGDRVVLVGSTLVEREQQYGSVELMLHQAFPQRNFIVRNLGWSADTVRGESRAGFGTVEEGFKKLIQQIKAEKPTLLIIGYGTNEAYWPGDTRKAFASGLDRFLKEILHPGMRLVFLTPPDPLGREAPASLSGIRAELARQQGKHKASLVELKDLFRAQTGLSDDGIIPNARGYQVMAKQMAEQLGWSDELPLRNAGEGWQDVRKLILEKNRLYFHRYRPQNETYLFGFRKHEQGQNAKEVPEFEPLVEGLDRKINEASLKAAAVKSR